MSCKPNIYVTNTTETAVLANGILPFTIITRRNPRGIDLNGNSVTIADCGSNYYLVNVNATFTAPVAGDVVLNLQQNGVNVVGATGSETITTATTEVRSISFQATIRTFNNIALDTLTVVNSGVEATFSNITLSVIKL